MSLHIAGDLRVAPEIVSAVAVNCRRGPSNLILEQCGLFLVHFKLASNISSCALECTERRLLVNVKNIHIALQLQVFMYDFLRLQINCAINFSEKL